MFINGGTSSTNASGITFRDGGGIKYYPSPASGTERFEFETDSTTVMVLDALGRLGIGTTSPANKLHIDGDSIKITGGGGIFLNSTSLNNLIYTSSNGSGSGTIYIGNATIDVTSDERIKKDIVDSKIEALHLLNKLRVVDFTWDDPSDTSFNNRNVRGKWTGVIAQDVIQHIPTMVNAPRKEEDLSIDYDNECTWKLDMTATVPMLIKAIQELSAKNEKLEARLAALES